MNNLRKGFPHVVDDVIPKVLLLKSAKELRNGKEMQRFGATHGQSTLLRTDDVMWLNEHTAKERGLIGTSEVISLFKQHISTSLSKLSDNGDIQAATCILPHNFMVSHYDGEKEAFYTAHRDGSAPATYQELWQCLVAMCKDTWRDGISAGFHTLNFAMDRFRSEKNFRTYTAILYLNVAVSSATSLATDTDTDATHEGEGEGEEVVWNVATEGGALRCFVGAEASDTTGITAAEVLDVSPTGGRVVMFPSRELLHAVLPTKLTAWIFSDAVLAWEMKIEISALCMCTGPMSE